MQKCAIAFQKLTICYPKLIFLMHLVNAAELDLTKLCPTQLEGVESPHFICI